MFSALPDSRLRWWLDSDWLRYYASYNSGSGHWHPSHPALALWLVRCHPDWPLIGRLCPLSQCYTSHSVRRLHRRHGVRPSHSGDLKSLIWKKTFTAFEKLHSKLVKYFVLNFLSPNSTFPRSPPLTLLDAGAEIKYLQRRVPSLFIGQWVVNTEFVSQRTREIFYKSTRRGGG